MNVLMESPAREVHARYPGEAIMLKIALADTGDYVGVDVTLPEPTPPFAAPGTKLRNPDALPRSWTQTRSFKNAWTTAGSPSKKGNTCTPRALSVPTRPPVHLRAVAALPWETHPAALRAPRRASATPLFSNSGRTSPASWCRRRNTCKCSLALRTPGGNCSYTFPRAACTSSWRPSSGLQRPRRPRPRPCSAL